MNYQEKVTTRAEVRALYEKVLKNPGIARYRGYTATKSYGWDAAVGDYFKREGEVWFENPAFDENYVAEEQRAQSDTLLDEQLENSERCIAQLNAEKSELCALIDTLNARIAAYQQDLEQLSGERDRALEALNALREALLAIRELTQVA